MRNFCHKLLELMFLRQGENSLVTKVWGERVDRGHPHTNIRRKWICLLAWVFDYWALIMTLFLFIHSLSSILGAEPDRK